MAKTHEIRTGNILIQGSTFFYVRNLREDALGMGLVFEGDVYVQALKAWKPSTLPIIALWGKDWNVMSSEAREMAVFSHI